jgi:hypothetical protein
LVQGTNDLLTWQGKLMSSRKTIAQLRQLRDRALWKLLASHNAPIVLAVLQELLLGEHRVVPASALHERLTQELLALKQAGEDMTQSAQAYVAAYSGDCDRLFRRNVTGDSAESVLDRFSTPVGHDQSRFRGVPPVMTGLD